MKRYRHERRGPARDAVGVEGVIGEVRVALGLFRTLTRRHVTGTAPLAPLAVSSCAAEHFAVLACMHARRRTSQAFADYVAQAIAHEAAVLGADGPLRPVLFRLLDARAAQGRTNQTLAIRSSRRS
jgi:hypothetical protein